MDRYSIATGNIPPQKQFVKEITDYVSKEVRRATKPYIGQGRMLMEVFVSMEKTTYHIQNMRIVEKDGKHMVFFVVSELSREEHKSNIPMLFRISNEKVGYTITTSMIVPLRQRFGRASTTLRGLDRSGMFEIRGVDMVGIRAILKENQGG